jgi:protein TonB
MDGRPDNTTLLLGGLPARKGWTLQRWITASIALHLLILAAFLHHRATLVVTARPGEPDRHRLILTYTPGSHVAAAALESQTSPKIIAPAPSRALAAKVNTPPLAPPATAASTSTSAITGADALGDGDIRIALVDNHPTPKPDLSQLPSGTQGDVVVDIVIDSTGKIAKYTVERGLGHGVDDTVIATIQGWTFHPATRNGIPVASEQELLFHYIRG